MQTQDICAPSHVSAHHELGTSVVTYELASFLEHVCHGLPSWNIFSDLAKTSHEVKQLLHDSDDIPVVTERFLEDGCQCGSESIELHRQRLRVGGLARHAWFLARPKGDIVNCGFGAPASSSSSSPREFGFDVPETCRYDGSQCKEAPHEQSTLTG